MDSTHPTRIIANAQHINLAAGLVEGLSASAHDFLSLGVSSPFLVSDPPVVPLLQKCRTDFLFLVSSPALLVP